MAFSFVRFVECVFILIDLTEKITAKSTTSTNSKNYVLNTCLCYVLWLQYNTLGKCYAMLSI